MTNELHEIFKFQLGTKGTQVLADFDEDVDLREGVEPTKVFYLLQKQDVDHNGQLTSLIYISAKSCLSDEIQETLGSMKFLRYGTQNLPVFEDLS